MTTKRKLSVLVATTCLSVDRCSGFTSPGALRPLTSSSVGIDAPVSICFVAGDDDGDETSKKKSDDEFWAKQRQLLSQMSSVANKSMQAEQRRKFAERRLALVSDTALFGFFIFCTLWTLFDNPFVAFSYALGATLGLAYAFGLGEYRHQIVGFVRTRGTSHGSVSFSRVQGSTWRTSAGIPRRPR